MRHIQSDEFWHVDNTLRVGAWGRKWTWRASSDALHVYIWYIRRPCMGKNYVLATIPSFDMASTKPVAEVSTGCWSVAYFSILSIRGSKTPAQHVPIAFLVYVCKFALDTILLGNPVLLQSTWNGILDSVSMHSICSVSREGVNGDPEEIQCPCCWPAYILW